MAYCCTSKQHETNFINRETADLVQRTNFSANEINDLRNRFYKISNSNKKLSKNSFKENMGLLGLDTVFLLSERVFQLMDEDQDGEISLGDFIKYMDILLTGDIKQKNELSFQMIDYRKKGWFDKNDLRELIESTITVWTHLTGNHLHEAFLKKIEFYVEHCFSRLDEKKDGKIDKDEFIHVMENEPDLLEIFDFLNRGGKNIFINEEIEKREHDEKFSRKIIKLEKNLKRVNDFMLENFPLTNMNQTEQYPADRNTLSPIFSPNNKIIYRQSSKLTNNDRYAKSAKIPMINDKNDKFPHITPILVLEDMNKNDKKGETSPNPVVKTHRGSIMYPKVHSFEKNFEKILNKITPTPEIHIENKNEFEIEGNHSNNFTYKDNKIQLNSIKPEFGPLNEENKQDQGYIQQIILNDENVIDVDESFSSRKPNNLTFNNSDFLIRGSLSDKEHSKHPKFEKLHSYDVSKNIENRISYPLTVNIDNSPLNKQDKIANTAIALKEMMEITKEIREDFDKNMLKYIDKTQKKDDNIFSKMATFTTQNVHKSTKNISDKKGMRLRKAKKSPTNINNNKTMVFLGHQNWNLVLNMMLGIQMAVKSTIPFGGYNLTSKDFQLKYYFELVPRRSEADKKTMFKICKFLDYAPYVFNEIRNLFGISKESYLRSIGPENLLSNLLKGNLNTLRELVSSGKSGSFFYYSADGKYTLKTIHRAEFHLIRKILPKYYEHLLGNPNSFIVKFYGLHKMRLKMKDSFKQNKIYFIIMSNVFQTPKEIHERYDIKGSRYKRYTKEHDPSIALKDMNAIENKFKLKLTKEHSKLLLEQLKKDCKFFEDNCIIDYSLLIGVHKFQQRIDSMNLDNESASFDLSLKTSKMMLEGNIDNTFQFVGFNAYDDTCTYYFGVIDILTPFNSKKKFEYGFKYLFHGSSISAIPPIPYSRRFQSFVAELIQTP